MSELYPTQSHHAPTRRLAGWTPASMRDWPGRVAATIRLGGRAPACAAPVATAVSGGPREIPDWRRIVGEMDAHPWLDGVVVRGHEPTEDPDLPSLLAALCDLGQPVRLETGGTRPDVLRHLIAEQLVECVALDIKTVPGRYDALSGRLGMAALVAESTELLIRSGVEHEFRTALDPACVALDELPRIARSLRGGRLYALQPCARPGANGGVGETPHPDAAALRAAAHACSAFLPTIVREPRRAGAPAA